MSMATMGSAPAMAAPCAQFSPTPPQPTTATDAPGSTWAVLSAAPTPVKTPHESKQPSVGGKPGGEATICEESTTISSAKAPTRKPAYIGSPSPPRKRGSRSMANGRAQIEGRPDSHSAQRPQERNKVASTETPGAISGSTPGPTAVTTPAASWPKIVGKLPPQAPSIYIKSEWQIAQAESFTCASPACGGDKNTVSSDNGALNSRHTAARTGLAADSVFIVSKRLAVLFGRRR